MAFTLAGRTLQRVAVIGSGNIGPDLALFFARALTRHGVPIVVHDVSKEALDSGREKFLRKLHKGTQSGLFRPVDLEALERNVTFTLDKSLLVGASLVVEAATENLEVKQSIFEELERFVPRTAILASNSSHLEPERIFARIRGPERALIHHFFFPAERNPLVELVAGPKTDVTDWCARFYESIGKLPIRAASRFGYAVNPVFEGVFLAAMLAEEQGHTPAIIDSIACRALGLTAGPFTVINMTGGNALTQTGLRGYHEKIMPWFRSPETLDAKVSSKSAWRTADKGETASYSNQMYEEISGQLLGAYFGLVCEVLESGIVSLGDLEVGVELGLAMKPPFALMNEMGPKKVKNLVTAYAKANPGFRTPKEFGPWTIPYVIREDQGDVAVLTIRRPKTLNALNREVFRQIDEQMTRIRDDAAVRGAVITGFGVKSFVSGADIGMLSTLATPEDARQLSLESHRVLRKIETLGKPVIAALNGFALGGGGELACACTARIARKGLPVLFGQPEVKLGIIPGAGGTQRLPRIIPFSAAWSLLRTGRTISGAEALQLGLILEETSGDLIERAVQLAREAPAPALREPQIPASLPEVDLKGLSRKVDEILRKAILQGAALPLAEALDFEARCFAEVFATRDRQIGLDNFLRTGLKQPAPFIHA